VLARRKFFTFVNLFGITLPLTILLTVATVLDHIFGTGPPETRQERTLGVYRVSLLDEEGDGIFAFPGYSLLDQLLRDLPGTEEISISSVFRKATLSRGGERIDSYLKHTDAPFWDILEFEFIEGGPFTRSDVDSGRFVAVINEATRERYFAGRTAEGRSITVDGRAYRVVGVVRNVPMLRLVPFSDVWVPQTTADDYGDDELYGFHMGLILARSSRDFRRIREDFLSRASLVDLSAYAPYTRLVVVPETTFDSVARTVFSLGRTPERQTGRLVATLILVAVLFLVLPTINLVNLSVSRIMERAPEIGVRRAFGAPASALVGQFVTENLLLTVIGGLLALLLSFMILGIVARTGVVPYAHFDLNPRILAYAATTTLLFGIVSGGYPAWRMSRMNPADALRGLAG
jgi:putative ABC transport system permease protein